MEIADLVAAESVIARLRVRGKKQALQELARRAAAHSGVEAGLIYARMLEREKEDRAAARMGVAVLHAKVPGVGRPYGIFARLERAIPFAAIDEEPVDLLFLLLSPETAGEEHLRALARVSRLLRDRTVCEKLRGTDNAEALYVLLAGAPAVTGA